MIKNQNMKRILCLAAFAAVLAGVFSCAKKNAQEPDPAAAQKPSVAYADGTSTSVAREYAPQNNPAIVKVYAPQGIAKLSLTFKEYPQRLIAILVTNIGVETNYTGKNANSPIMDMITDAKAVEFLKTVGVEAGISLKGATSASIDVTAVLSGLISALEATVPETTFAVVVDVTDAQGNSTNATIAIHYTPGPTFAANFNPPVELNGTAKDLKVTVEAGGGIAELTLVVETDSQEMAKFIKARTSNPDGKTLDLIGDDTVKEHLGAFFSDKIEDAKKAEVNLRFLFDRRAEMQAEGNSRTSVFFTVTDKNGKKKEMEFQFLFSK